MASSALLQADFPIRETIPYLDLKAFYTAGQAMLLKLLEFTGVCFVFFAGLNGPGRGK